MKIGYRDPAERPLVIAEIGANHEGDLDAAKAMIRAAAAAGADAVKFQTYKAEKIVARTEASRFAHFQRMSLPDAAFVELAEEARAHGVLFLSTPFDLDAVASLDPLVPAFKIASGDLTFTALLEAVARTGKPVLLSTGMATLDEIGQALDTIARAAGLARGGLASRVVLLHCVASYPAPPEEVNLRAIPGLRAHFGVPVGYSDHALGLVACLGALALGACVIEKHFTLQKEGRAFRDHQLSADPADLLQLTTAARAIGLMLGDGLKRPTPAEEANRGSMRRSLAARIDIHEGERITRDHVTCLRPGTGLPPSLYDQVIGRVALADVPAGHHIPASAVGIGE